MMTGAGRREEVGDGSWEAGRGWERVLGGGKGLGTGAGRQEGVGDGCWEEGRGFLLYILFVRSTIF